MRIFRVFVIFPLMVVGLPSTVGCSDDGGGGPRFDAVRAGGRL